MGTSAGTALKAGAIRYHRPTGANNARILPSHLGRRSVSHCTGRNRRRLCRAWGENLMRLAERIDLTRDLRELWALACDLDHASIESGIGQSAARPFSAGNCYARRYNELLAQRYGLHAISGVTYAVIAPAPAPDGRP